MNFNFHSSLNKSNYTDDSSKIYLGEGVHDVETDGRNYFRWVSDSFNVYVLDPEIKSIFFDIYADHSGEGICTVGENKMKYNFKKGLNKFGIVLKEKEYKINFSQSYFIPSELHVNSRDNRKLSYRLYFIKLVYKDGNEEKISIKDIEYNIEKYILEEFEDLDSNDSLETEDDEFDGKNETKVYNVGGYGEMFIKVLKNNPHGKINLNLNQTSFYSHRSGWNYVIQNMIDYHNKNGIIFDGFLENAFSWRKESNIENEIIPYDREWIGVFHNPPNMPLWFSDNNAYPQTIIHDEYFRESLEMCQGIYVLSDYYKRFLSNYITDVPINVLYHPTEIPNDKFNIENFKNNKRKKLINIGWWLRKLNSIYLVDSGKYEKIRLMPNNKCKDTIVRLQKIEQDLYNIKLSNEQVKSVMVMDHLENDEYDKLLTENVVFLDLYDTSANNAVIECIARGTPLLINKHPATTEYLGENYPFYFENLKEAYKKLNDDDLIEETHNYLMNFENRKQITIENFKEQFENSEIYKGL